MAGREPKPRIMLERMIYPQDFIDFLNTNAQEDSSYSLRWGRFPSFRKERVQNKIDVISWRLARKGQVVLATKEGNRKVGEIWYYRPKHIVSFDFAAGYSWGAAEGLIIKINEPIEINGTTLKRQEIILTRGNSACLVRYNLEQLSGKRQLDYDGDLILPRDSRGNLIEYSCEGRTGWKFVKTPTSEAAA